MTTLTWTRVRRAVAARRRVLSAALAGLAVLSALSVLRPAGPPTTAVLVAARDLAAGSVLAAADLRSVALPLGAVPSGAFRPGATVLGRVVAGPVRRGEPLTDVRIAGPALLATVPGTVAVPVRFADPGVAALLRSGDHIDVLAAPPDTAPPDTPLPDTPPTGAPPPAPLPTARVAAADVVVLLVSAEPADVSGGTLVVVACSPDVARALAAAAATDRLSPALRAPAPPGHPP